jgi:hypothetical protein
MEDLHEESHLGHTKGMLHPRGYSNDFLLPFFNFFRQKIFWKPTFLVNVLSGEANLPDTLKSLKTKLTMENWQRLLLMLWPFQTASWLWWTLMMLLGEKK